MTKFLNNYPVINDFFFLYYNELFKTQNSCSFHWNSVLQGNYNRVLAETKGDTYSESAATNEYEQRLSTTAVKRQRTKKLFYTMKHLDATVLLKFTMKWYVFIKLSSSVLQSEPKRWRMLIDCLHIIAYICWRACPTTDW